ncbi:hypothetical protein RM545_06510 [Zunongwangia sp. F260]|uniref:Uncharacterized protein n=1 Tax=Autumnicola lenta TaxID=3075593 RepID=A0ABU3CIZ6_9FLAO|nr:hypothetical protein [Zunongwangia sp. F260]MDT0646337.1 hypothetical protein [Zunongwangia sp. F260]
MKYPPIDIYDFNKHHIIHLTSKERKELANLILEEEEPTPPKPMTYREERIQYYKERLLRGRH